ncbi:hypothetical protein MMC28_009794 [Mycoblastus sanguinarius]|nr:hypothetical protein [Mycoblastus sanguinarius]
MVSPIITLLVTSTVLAPLVNATRLKRNPVATEPPCSVPFTPFLYAGCYTDPSSPRALPFSPAGLDTQNMTVEICVAECKGNGYRYAGLEYYGECFCGDSIAGASTTESACTYPCTGNKSETCGGSDILSVYMDPTFPPTDDSTISDYSPEGCYTEGTNGRAVVYRQNQLSSSNLTTELCLETCKSQNYPLAATEYSGDDLINAVSFLELVDFLVRGILIDVVFSI